MRKNIYTEQVSVGTTATKLVTHGDQTKDVLISVPSGGSTVYVGPSDVTTSTGVAVTGGATLTLSDYDDKSGTLYGIVASGTQTVEVMTTG